MNATLRNDRTYPHPRACVWRALTDPEQLALWLMPNDFQPIVGHRFTFRTDPGPGFDGIVRCEVLELAPEERMVLSWVGGPIDTRVSFTLSDAPGGCRLVVEQTGFKGLRAWMVSRILAMGSRTIYGRRLPSVLDSLAGATPPSPLDIAGCSGPSHSLWRRCLAILTRRASHGQS